MAGFSPSATPIVAFTGGCRSAIPLLPGKRQSVDLSLTFSAGFRSPCSHTHTHTRLSCLCTCCIVADVTCAVVAVVHVDAITTATAVADVVEAIANAVSVVAYAAGTVADVAVAVTGAVAADVDLMSLLVLSSGDSTTGKNTKDKKKKTLSHSRSTHALESR